MDADTSLVPKTINKDGATLNLTNISWKSAASDNIDGYDLAVRYTAIATYSGYTALTMIIFGNTLCTPQKILFSYLALHRLIERHTLRRYGVERLESTVV